MHQLQASNEKFLSRLLKVAVLAAAYYYGGKFGLTLAYLHPSASPVWPPTGIALAAVLLWGPRIWPGIWLGAFLVNLNTAGTAATSVAIAIGNTLEVLLGAWLVNRFAGGSHAFEQTRSLLRFFVFAAVLSTMVSPTIGVTTLMLAGFTSSENYLPVWLTWWSGDMSSALIITPLLLTWSDALLRRRTWQHVIVAVFSCASVIAIGLLVFGHWLPEPLKPYQYAYWCFPALLWPTVRFGQRGAITSAVALSGIALWGTLEGSGPFASRTPNDALLVLQGFMATITMTNLLLASALSEHRRTQDALRQSEQNLHKHFLELENLYTTAPVGLGLVNRDLRYVRINERLAAINGLSVAQHLGRTLREILPELADSLEPIHRNVLETGYPILDMEIAGTTPAQRGVERTWLASYYPVKGVDGRIDGVSVVVQEITERKRTEEALRETEAQLRLITDNTPVMLTRCSRDRRYLFVNRAAAAFLGLPADAIAGRDISDVIGDTAYQTIRPYVNSVLQGKTVEYELEVPYRETGTRYIHAVYVPEWDKVGEVCGWTAAINDITLRRRAEKALMESEVRFRTMAEAAPVMIWISGPDKLCTYFNKPWLDFTGRTMEQELGNGWAEGVHRDDLSRCLDIYTASFDARREFQMEYRLRHHDGGYRWILDHGVPRFGSAHEFVGYIGSCVDITEHKVVEQTIQNLNEQLEHRVVARTAELTATHRRLEAAMEERQRLETEIGRIAEREQRRMSLELHEGLGQELAGIGFLLASLEAKINTESPSLREDIVRLQEMISRSIHGVRKLAQGVYPVSLDVTGLRGALEGLAEKVEQLFSISCRVRPEVPPGTTLKGPGAAQLYHIAREALDNAVKHARARHIEIQLNISGSGGVMMSVKDDGMGFPTETKNMPGMGLHMMRYRAKILGGALDLSNDPSGGANVTVTCSMPPGGSNELGL